MRDDILGIDFGTTNSAMAFIEMEEPHIIKNNEGTATTPSVVHFPSKGEPIVGQEAKHHVLVDPGHTVRSIKRKMGTGTADRYGRRKYPPEAIGAYIIKKIVNDASAQVKRKFNRTIITVPAYFRNQERQAVKDVAEIAGLAVSRVINEPTAAALAFGYKADEERTVLVYDFGGGTFDVSILTLGDGFFDVDATSGDSKLGGDDIDERLGRLIIKRLKDEMEVDVSRDLAVLQTIREAAEAAKIELSSRMETRISIPFVTDRRKRTRAFDMELSRKEFNTLIKPFIRRTGPPIERALADAGLQIEDIEDVILVGGTTRIPALQEHLSRMFGRKVTHSVNPDEAVALGAALASMETGEERKGRGVDVSDVISHSLGVLTVGNVFSRIIKRNTKIPIKCKQTYSNFAPFTPQVKIEVFQGDDEVADKNELLGDFLVEVEPMPPGMNKIDVTFRIGEEFGILEVKAQDHDSGNERVVRVESRGVLTKGSKKRWMELISVRPLIELVFNEEKGKKRVTKLVHPNSMLEEIRSELITYGLIDADSILQRDGSWLDLGKSIQEAGMTDGTVITIGT